uniref:histidine kinase dimerization/phospho-acceptor domain-containing protein n=1 Tax=Agathobacter sp. TaxID=2021311 RepID=UPI004055CCDB
MIKLLKNKEVRRTLFLQIVVAAIACIFSFTIDERAGMVAVVLSLLLILIYYISTYRRYKRIATLAGDVNKLLHGDNTISLENYSEGELGILHSEIYKMTIRLREQQQKLLNDKVYLADSIADISHQIRTPLTSINLLVQFLSEPNLTDERRQQLTHELYGLLSRID